MNYTFRNMLAKRGVDFSSLKRGEDGFYRKEDITEVVRNLFRKSGESLPPITLVGPSSSREDKEDTDRYVEGFKKALLDNVPGLTDDDIVIDSIFKTFQGYTLALQHNDALSPDVLLKNSRNISKMLDYCVNGTSVNSLSEDFGVVVQADDLYITVHITPRNSEYFFLGDVIYSDPEGPGVVGNTTYIPGVNYNGDPLIVEYSAGTHTIITGGTGSGKTGLLATLFSQIFSFSDPKEVQAVILDPKLSPITSLLADFPHCVGYVGENQIPEYVNILKTLQEMFKGRHELLKSEGVRTFDDYNIKYPESALPLINLVVDELPVIKKELGKHEYEAFEALINDFLAFGDLYGVNVTLITQDSEMIRHFHLNVVSDIYTLKSSLNFLSKLNLFHEGTGVTLINRGEFVYVSHKDGIYGVYKAPVLFNTPEGLETELGLLSRVLTDIYGSPSKMFL